MGFKDGSTAFSLGPLTKLHSLRLVAVVLLILVSSCRPKVWLVVLMQHFKVPIALKHVIGGRKLVGKMCCSG